MDPTASATPIPLKTVQKVFIPGLIKEVYTAGSRYTHDGPLTLIKCNVAEDGKRVSFEWAAVGSSEYSVTAEGIIEIKEWKHNGPIYDRTKFEVECDCPDGERQYTRNAESNDKLYVCKHAKAALDTVCDPKMTQEFPNLLARNKQQKEQERENREKYLQAQREEQEKMLPGERERMEYGLSKRTNQEIADLVKERVNTTEGLAALCRLFPATILPPKKSILCGRCNKYYDPNIKSDLTCSEEHPYDRVDRNETFHQCLRCYKTFNVTSEDHFAIPYSNKRRRLDGIREEGYFCYVTTHVPHDVYDRNDDHIIARLSDSDD